MKTIIEDELKQSVSDKNFYEGKVVAVNNYFTRRHFNLDLLENKSLYLIFSHTSHFDFENNRILINKANFLKELGLKKQNSKYKILKQIIKNLLSKIFFDFGDGKNEEGMMAFIRYKFSNDSGKYIELYLNQYLSLALIELKGNFTKTLISSILKFKSNNVLNFYKLLCSYNHKKVLVLTVEQIKSYLGLDKKAYLNEKGYFRRSVFNKQCLEKIKQEINNFSELDLDFKLIKKDYQFKWTTKEKYYIEPKTYTTERIENLVEDDSLKNFVLEQSSREKRQESIENIENQQTKLLELTKNDNEDFDFK